CCSHLATPPHSLLFPTRRSSDLVDHARPHLAPGDKPWDIERPVRWCRQAGFIAVAGTRQRCPNWHGAHPSHDVGTTGDGPAARRDRKSTRLNSSHGSISYAVFCL